MSAQILSGTTLATEIFVNIKTKIAQCLKQNYRNPCLTIILVGNDFASECYVSRKIIKCKEVGVNTQLFKYDSSISEKELIAKIHYLNADHAVDAILVQFPLPKTISKKNIVAEIHPDKDVDGVHPLNLGKVMQGSIDSLVACTPAGIMKLLAHYKIILSGKNVVLIGCSMIIGKPLIGLLLKEKATVVVTHRHTKNLIDYTKTADIIISAAGSPCLIKEHMVSSQVIIIDVSTNRTSDNKLIGDADFGALQKKVLAITPVPGGVGSLTIAMILVNVFKIYQKKLFSNQ